jgi:hypothetical protein
MQSKFICLFCLILVLGLVGTSVAGNVDPDIVGWWTFDDGAGTVAKDLSSNGVDAIFFGGPTWATSPGHGGVLTFDGVDDYVFIDGFYSVPVYTATLWFRVDGGTAQRDIFSAYARGVLHGIFLELQAGGTLRYLHRYPLGTGGGTNVYTTETYDDGAWYHVAMVKSVDTIALYVDGVEVASAADNSVFNPGDAFGVALGCLDNERGLARMFPGAMDDVRIYDRPMTQTEIQSVVDAEPWPYAYGPTPNDGALYSDTWVNLSWVPGVYAASHDVYIGDNFDDVNNGAEGTFGGNQEGVYFIAGFPGFAIPDGLIPGTTYYWRVDEVNDAHPESPWKGDVWSFTVPSKKAYEPNPADGAKFIDPDVTLSWTPGFGARLHTIYFGDDADVVGNATGGAPLTSATYTPGALELGKTYYWRVDEFDGSQTYMGDVWSFTVAGAGGGVRGDYYKGTNFNTFVLSRTDPQIDFTWPDGTGPDPSVGNDNFSVQWTGEIEAAFTEKYTFYTNSDAGVRLWVDGQQLVDNWTAHTNMENSGVINLVAGQVYSLQMEYYEDTGEGVVELLWSSAHTPKQIVPQAAMSPPIKASSPRPANGATGTSLTPILTWGAGDYAASHEVYFGTDEEAVTNATQGSPEYIGTRALGNETYDPGKLEWATTYYWRVDEVNDVHPDSPWVGNVWSFTTGDFLLIDNFEDYTDDDQAGEAIWQAWIDGFGVADNGAQVGYLLPPYAERTIVHSGSQSMPLFYTNEAGVRNSEAVLSLTSPRDWTDEGVAELSLWFRGIPGAVGSFVEGPTGTYTITATGTDIAGTADEFHFAYKQLSGAGGVVSGFGSIEAQVLSVQNTDQWAKAGVMIRETLEPGSKFAAVYITPGMGCRFQTRRDTDIAVVSDTTIATDEQMAIQAPYWVKLERTVTGGFNAYYSSDGIIWQAMAWNPQTVSMTSNVYIGLALSAHNANAVCEAKFSNVQMTGTITGQWQAQDIGIESNAAEPLYVAISNSGGAPAVVAHENPDAATIDVWTEWVIPLQAFADQGINLTNVDKIAIGLGAKGNAAAAGGSGQMYIDDIRLYRPREAAEQ